MKKPKSEAKGPAKYEDFHVMMEALGGLTMKDVRKLVSKDSNLNYLMKAKFEGEEGGYAYIFACYPNDPMVRQIAEEFDLQIVTNSILDGEDREENNGEETESESIFIYQTGMHYDNRERYYFCKSREEAYCEEKV